MGSTVKPTYLRMFFEKKYKQSNISRWKDINILGYFFHDEVAEWHGRWFSPGTLASYTTKTGRHDIAEILLKVALNTKNQIIISQREGSSCV
jgi:hypothetical protein